MLYRSVFRKEKFPRAKTRIIENTKTLDKIESKIKTDDSLPLIDDYNYKPKANSENSIYELNRPKFIFAPNKMEIKKIIMTEIENIKNSS